MGAFVEGLRDNDAIGSTDPGDGAKYVGRDRQSRYASERDTRKGTGPTIRDRKPFADSGRPVATGAASSVAVPSRQSARLDIPDMVRPIAIAAIVDTLAAAPSASVERIAARADRLDTARGTHTTGDTVERAAASIMRGEQHGHDGAPATAARVDRAIRESNSASRYALDPSVSGALYAPTMRVKAKSGAGIVADRPASYSPDACAARLDSARAVAIREIERAIASWKASKGRDKIAAAKHAKRIAGMLHTWEHDAIVTESARTAGWRI